MAESISEICRNYVFENADNFKGVAVDQAVSDLAKGAEIEVAKQGWEIDDDAYGVDIKQVVRQTLLKIRDNP